MARGVLSKRVQIAGIVTGVIAAVALVPMWRTGVISRHSVQLAVGLVFVALGLFEFYRLATGEGADPKTAHDSKRGPALLYVGHVLFGVGQILIQTWVGVAIIWVAVVFMASHWFLRKTPAAKATP